MDRNQILGMVCGYYLSRFDEIAYARLGHRTQQATHTALADALGVPHQSIKNWRDEFDPVHENGRQGWHSREMFPSRKRTLEALGHLSEPELFGLIDTITSAPTGQQARNLMASLSDSADDHDESYGLRGPTGAKAERYFCEHHSKTGEPVAGELFDRTDDQCGYDFEIRAESGLVAVEVKGLAGNQGGVTLTNNEWETAKRLGGRYVLALVRQVASSPSVSFIRNPAACLDAQMRTFTTIQIGWSITHGSLKNAEADRGS